MTHEFKKQAGKMAADKLKSYGGESKGGWFKGGDKSSKTPSRKGFAFGGLVEGESAAPRADRPSGKKGSTTVNVIVAPPQGDQQPMQPPMPPPVPQQRVPVPIPTAPPMGGPPGPGGPPPGMGGPPGMRYGGRAGFKSGGTVKMDATAPSGAILGGALGAVGKGLDKIKGKEPPPAPVRAPRATGGSVNMDAGAGSAEGRLEKIKDYGKRSS